MEWMQKWEFDACVVGFVEPDRTGTHELTMDGTLIPAEDQIYV